MTAAQACAQVTDREKCKGGKVMKKRNIWILAMFLTVCALGFALNCQANAADNSKAYSYDPHTLSDFGYRTVKTGGRGNLVFQSEPGGSVISGYSYPDGSRIYVNLYWREKGYTLAYENGVYGFVDAGYIDWFNGDSSGSKYDPHTLSDYGYRTVTTGGRGNLVFQVSPGGSVMSGHSYPDGSRIYVNLYWRENGYAMAYDNGVYGYVDAGYINWSGSVTPTPAYDPHKLSDFGYRKVATGGRGNLVFQTEPGGAAMDGYSYPNGSTIYVNLYWREKGYTLAYENGVYGFVDAGYIDWSGSGSSGSTNNTAYDPHDLSAYVYRPVKTNGRGALVFQAEPGGAFMSDHSFNEGAWIYVHPYWREKGYAIAYDAGTFGFVDAGYIQW